MRSLLWDAASRVRHVTLGGGSGGLPVVVCGFDGGVIGFAGCVSDGLQVEEFYDFFVFTDVCVLPHEWIVD